MTSEAPPLISYNTALFCAFLYTAFFIAPYYLSATLRATNEHGRDSPTIIRARVRAAGLTIAASTIVTTYLLAIKGHATPQDVLRLYGLYPIHLLDILKVLTLALILYTGPLYETLLVDGGWRSLTPQNFKAELYDSWTGYRNLLIAPIAEELVFRSASVPLFLLAKLPPSRIVLTIPLIFGLAHFHHIFDQLRHRTAPGKWLPPLGVVVQLLVMMVFQFGYTSLFGFFTAFVLLRTGNIYAAIVAHSFCNFMGLPRVYGWVGQFTTLPPHVTVDASETTKRDDDERSDGKVTVGNSLMQQEDGQSAGSAEREKAAKEAYQQPQNLGLQWTVGYYVLLVTGAFGFYRLLYPLTASSNALATL